MLADAAALPQPQPIAILGHTLLCVKLCSYTPTLHSPSLNFGEA